VVGGQLAIAIGYQGDLRRPDRLAQCQQARITGAWRCKRVAFDVEFHPARSAQRTQRVHVVAADVARVGARMHGEAVGAGIEAGHARREHAGLVAAA